MYLYCEFALMGFVQVDDMRLLGIWINEFFGYGVKSENPKFS